MSVPDEKVFNHPSYGMISVSRIQNGPGGTALFGSAIRDHHSTFRIRIHEGERKHHLSTDWYNATSRLPHIEVELSAVQFADLFTTMNIGDGTPCTIRYVNGKQVNNPPEARVEAQLVEDGFKAKMRAIGGKLSKLVTDVETVIAKKALTIADRNFVRQGMDRFVTEIGSNLPFMVESFNEATAKIVSAAKAEADAWMTNTVTRLGLDALRVNIPALDAPPRVKLPALGEGVVDADFKEVP